MMSATQPPPHQDQRRAFETSRHVVWFSKAVPLIAAVNVLAVALAFRLPRLDVPNDNYDEGVYVESLLLMHDGYRPFRDIVATQGPLHLYVAYPPYALGGHTLFGGPPGDCRGIMPRRYLGRRGSRRALWRWSGLGAALILALSPTYLL